MNYTFIILCHILDIMLKTGINLDHFWLKNKLFKNGLLYVTYWAVPIVGHDIYIYYMYIYIELQLWEAHPQG